MTITEFITARLGEKEAYARLLVSPDGPADTSGMVGLSRQMLREVEATRAIVERWTDARMQVVEHGRAADDAGRGKWEAVTLALTHIVVSIAAVYSDHPDYLKEWAP